MNRVLDFSRNWLEAWNAHDIDGVLEHFAPEAVFTSPTAARFLPATAGILRGKDAIRSYWSMGLERIPDLHFEVVNVYTGVETLVINYRNQIGGLVNEILHFDEADLVDWGAGTYLLIDTTA